MPKAPVRGQDSLWGEIDYVLPVVSGAVYLVGTPGHGGLLIAPQWAERHLSLPARRAGEADAGWLAYEEDCRWSIPLYEHEGLRQVYHAATEDARSFAEFTTDVRATCAHWNRVYAAAVGLTTPS